MSYVRLIADDSIVSKLIQGTLHEAFSHVGFRTGPDDSWLDCRWSLGKSDGVQVRPADSVKDTRHYDFTFDGIEEAVKYGKTLIGTKYDLSNIAGFVFDPNMHNPHELICSRFVQECAAKVGNPLVNPAIPFYNVPPAWLATTVARGFKELDRWPTNLWR